MCSEVHFLLGSLPLVAYRGSSSSLDVGLSCASFSLSIVIIYSPPVNISSSVISSAVSIKVVIIMSDIYSSLKCDIYFFN